MIQLGARSAGLLACVHSPSTLFRPYLRGASKSLKCHGAHGADLQGLQCVEHTSQVPTERIGADNAAVPSHDEGTVTQ